MLPQASVAPDGSLYVTTVAPLANDPRVGGVAVTPDNVVRVNFNTPQQFDQGKAFTNNGALCINAAGDPTVGYVGGLPVTATGALKCQLNQPVSPGDAFVGGIRVGPLGGVYITDTAPPPPFSFSNGFDDGYPSSDSTDPLPENTALPAITGVPQSSNTLTCSPGTWVGANGISFRWLRNGVPMIGETASTLLVYSTYIGDMIGCAVTALNASGAETAYALAVEIIP
jgi:hypothetical protein